MVPTLAAEPHVPEHLRDHWRAFTDCYHGDGDPIAQPEMEAWFNNNGIAIDEREEFIAVIRALDKVWRVEVREKLAERQRARVK